MESYQGLFRLMSQGSAFISKKGCKQHISPRSLDLVTLWPWPQKSTKSIPEVSIQWLSGLGSGSRQNYTQKPRFDSFLALAPEIDKINTRSLNLMTFWPWLSKPRFSDQRASQPASSQPTSQPARQPANPTQSAQAAQPSPGSQPSSAINQRICFDVAEIVNKSMFSDAKK